MIGLFGGSFDPIHHGHLIVAQTAVEALGLDELRFVPAREQPFKVGRHGATAEDRARMISLAIAGQPRFVLERIELDRPGPSYTVDTLRELHRREPHRSFAILVGADAARELILWREAEALPALAQIVLVARPGLTLPDLRWPVGVITVPAIEISATAVRGRVAAGHSIRYWVPDSVAEFIRTNGLYLSDA
jgi:nicotinate-nucleotide adenylyltransferase